MKARTETSAVADVETQPTEVKDTNPTTEAPKTSVLAPHKERIAGHLQSMKALVQTKKFMAISGAVVLLLVLVFALPFTRYKVLGLVIKRDLNIAVNDTATQRSVSGATVEIDGKSFVTNKDGIAELKGIHVGDRTVSVTKKHYKDLKAQTVITLQKGRTVGLKLEATGRQVPVVVKNKVGGAPVSDALLKAGDSDTRTDKDGMAVIVVPVGSDEIKAKLTANGYNDADVTVKVTESAVPENTFSLTPSGKVYFLSRQTGKIDVVKTNLDGTNRETVVAGTGKEDAGNTVLLASRDWKYLALLSKRESDKAKLYLVETDSGKLTTIDEGDATFSLSGWSGHTFVYSLTRGNLKFWEAKFQALKSFNADTKKIALIDESRALGINYASADWYLRETFEGITVFEDAIVYNKVWTHGPYRLNEIAANNHEIVRVKPDGSDRRTLKALPADSYYLTTRLYEPREIIYRYAAFRGGSVQFFEYEDGVVKDAKDINDGQFNGSYPTYLLSPSGNHTLWSDVRDGKNVLFTGDKDAKDEKMIASFSGLTPYGWYSDDYVLVSKRGSELYVMPKSGVRDESELVKVSDYHRPGQSFYGYGGGYGGL